jgi:hypothetical protein
MPETKGFYARRKSASRPYGVGSEAAVRIAQTERAASGDLGIAISTIAL